MRGNGKGVTVSPFPLPSERVTERIGPRCSKPPANRSRRSSSRGEPESVTSGQPEAA